MLLSNPIWSSGQDPALSPPWPGFDSRCGNDISIFSLHSFSPFLSCAYLLFLTPTKCYFLFLSLLISVTLKAMVAALLVFLHSLLDLIMMVHLIFIRLTHQEHIMHGRQLNCNHINLIQLHNLILSTELIAIID